MLSLSTSFALADDLPSETRQEPVPVQWTQGEIRVGRVLRFKHDFQIDPMTGTTELSSRDRQANNPYDYDFCGVLPAQQEGRGRSTSRQRLAEDFVREFIDPVVREKALFRKSVADLPEAKRNEKLKEVGLSATPSAEESLAMLALNTHEKEIASDYLIQAKDNNGPRDYRIEGLQRYISKDEDKIFLGVEIRLKPVSPIANLQRVASVFCFHQVLEDRLPEEVRDDYWAGEQDLNKIYLHLAISEEQANKLLLDHVEIRDAAEVKLLNEK